MLLVSSSTTCPHNTQQRRDSFGKTHNGVNSMIIFWNTNEAKLEMKVVFLGMQQQLIESLIGKKTFLGATKETFILYWRKLQETKDKRLTKDIQNFSVEALTKFSQLDYLLIKIKEIEGVSEKRRQESIGKTNIHNQWVENLKSSNEDYKKFPLTQVIVDSITDDTGYRQIITIELFTEAFYYISHRLKKIIEYYPGLKNIKAPGVVNVRNNLIEHPTGKNGVASPSFAIGGPNGPVVKAGRYVGQEHIYVDVGLYKNAEEFRDNLDNTLRKGLESL